MPRMSTKTRRITLLVALIVAGVLAGSGAASANWSGRYHGLLNYDSSGNIIGEISVADTYSNLNKKLPTDPGGDRQQTWAKFRDRMGANNRPTYVRMSRYANGSYCYISQGVALSAGPSGQPRVQYTASGSCTSGWYYNNQSSTSASNSTAWRTYYFDFPFIATADSQRVTARVCEDSPAFLEDPCSGSRFLGVSY